uniref:Putative p21-activated protein n=1 Tax=Culex tarsalis TaxID=7177 RepID=A0A1Q3EXA7_CULTA
MAGLELIVGTYEEYTVGYKVEPFKTDPSRQYLKEIFSTHNHTASVRVLASHGKLLASGGADDRICIFDLETGTLRDELLHHNGTVNCLTFSADGSYLFSGSQDGTIAAINVKKLAVDKTWRNAHKAAVLTITIHPRGKLALSLGADMTLRTWDLVTGRTIYTRGLKGDSRFGGLLSWVEWSPDGAHFALVGNRVVDVVSVDTTKSARTVTCSARPVSLCWISDTELAVGLDDGHLVMFDLGDGPEVEPEKIRAYETRLKAMAIVGNHLATASSSGDISLWEIEGSELHELCTTNIGCRPTCMVLVEADRHGLHKYLRKQEDSKEDLKNQLKKIHAIGKVIVEHEDPLQAAATQKSQKNRKNKKRPAGDQPSGFSTPLSKKSKSVTSSLKAKSYEKNTSAAASGIWEEEDAGEVEPSEPVASPEKKKKKAKKGNGLSQTIAGAGVKSGKKNKEKRRGSL